MMPRLKAITQFHQLARSSSFISNQLQFKHFFHINKMTQNKPPVFTIDPFADRHWDGGDSVQVSVSKEEFLNAVHDHFFKNDEKLVDGYAPFCKHIFIPNTFGVKQTTIEITEENVHLLKSDYVSRREDELAVLTRWFPASKVEVVDAKFLDVILYSREQVKKENEAMGHASIKEEDMIPWAIISIKGQDVDYETPMQPITMMRNSLGREEGGSGVPIDREKYRKSVAYWKNHAIVQ